MGVYLSDSVTKYINFYNIIKVRTAKYPFAIFNIDRENEPGSTSSFLDIIQRKTFYYLIVLVLLVLKNLF